MNQDTRLRNDLSSRVLFAGGGTGGHIFPALALAAYLQQENPFCQIEFVGAKDRMEMEKIPQAGYTIHGLNIMGLDRKRVFRNILVLYKLIGSLAKAYRIVRRFNPSVVVGMGGYSCLPVLFVARLLRIPTIIQEQNAFAGLANRLLGKNATHICLGYAKAKRFFVPEKCTVTGNPIRQEIINAKYINAQKAKLALGLRTDLPLLFVIGGSLGCKRINVFFLEHLDAFVNAGLQIIWQTGTDFYTKAREKTASYPQVQVFDFVTDMAQAYAGADIIVSRAGAIAIAEICAVTKCAVFIPYQRATENHQFHNANTLFEANACRLIKEKDIDAHLLPTILRLLEQPEERERIQQNMSAFTLTKATQTIGEIILRYCRQRAKTLRNVYMIGIGGSGMQALAQYLLSKGVKVSGYDRDSSAFSEMLAQQNVPIYRVEDKKHITSGTDWVIYTPAINANHLEKMHAESMGLPVLKRSFALGHLTRDGNNICVAGAHGKTTTSSMVASILQMARCPYNAFIGGQRLPDNPCPDLPANDCSQYPPVNVIEADEFDRSFLRLCPSIAVITSVDEDHLDIYQTKENLLEAYQQFVYRLKEDGLLIVHQSVMDKHPFATNNTITYSAEDERADIFARNIQYTSRQTVQFTVHIGEDIYAELELSQGATFMVNNALAAVGVARHLRIPPPVIQQALANYRGVRRRFECVAKNAKQVYINDYAHHPEEIKQTMQAVRNLYPNKKMTVIFQPHLYSRTKDFYQDFARSLSLADEVIFLPIYPAREQPIPGVSSAMIADCMANTPTQQMDIARLCFHIVENLNSMEVIVSIGAGADLEKIPPVLQTLIQTTYAQG